MPGPFCARMEPVNRQVILDRLRENERSLRERGVTHAALFGSRAREDARPDSDIDILIEIEPSRSMGVFEYIGVVRSINDLFPIRVDVAERMQLKPHVFGHRLNARPFSVLTPGRGVIFAIRQLLSSSLRHVTETRMWTTVYEDLTPLLAALPKSEAFAAIFRY
jgi:uncharacterized protein